MFFAFARSSFFEAIEKYICVVIQRCQESPGATATDHTMT